MEEPQREMTRDELIAELLKRRQRIAELERRLANIQRCVDEQAEDEGLWFQAATAPEAYLQQELRVLHGIIEADVEFIQERD